MAIARRSQKPGLQLEILNDGGRLPREPEKNTAGIAALQVLKQLGVKKEGMYLQLHKGIPMVGGLGSSAGSAVAGAVAANALFGSPLSREDLIEACVAAGGRGERVPRRQRGGGPARRHRHGPRGRAQREPPPRADEAGLRPCPAQGGPADLGGAQGAAARLPADRCRHPGEQCGDAGLGAIRERRETLRRRHGGRGRRADALAPHPRLSRPRAGRRSTRGRWRSSSAGPGRAVCAMCDSSRVAKRAAKAMAAAFSKAGVACESLVARPSGTGGARRQWRGGEPAQEPPALATPPPPEHMT
ncbi:MAG: hypothetical protein M5R40_25455 [Anaerolineae bacterium]|nr:hypothetical protein [Anaerolineae bacterium]